MEIRRFCELLQHLLPVAISTASEQANILKRQHIMALCNTCTRSLTFENFCQKFLNKGLDIDALKNVLDLYMKFASELDSIASTNRGGGSFSLFEARASPEDSNLTLIRSYIVLYASMLACAVSDVLLEIAPQMFDHHQGEAEREFHAWLKEKSILPDNEASQQPGTHL